jgi:cytochrome c peroxidase
MWDGREPSLNSQANDATLIHAQAVIEPTSYQITQIVNFESHIFDAQVRDHSAGRLTAHGANGGPVSLSNQNFYIGINDVLGGDPLNPGIFTPNVFIGS